jgi:hypothetical protein
LILNKKSIGNQENQLFQAELEKFRVHQNRLIQAQHKQSSLMKELTTTYGTLLQDKRVRAEQSKYEAITRQRNSVLLKYKKIHQAFKDLSGGLEKATEFYSDMTETVRSLQTNVDAFVKNRRSEGVQLLLQIEKEKETGQADRERERLKGLMERMSMETPPPPPKPGDRPPSVPAAPYRHSSTTPGSTPSSLVAPRYPSAGIMTNYGQPAYPYSVPQNGNTSGSQQRRESSSTTYSQAVPSSAEGYNPANFRSHDSYQPSLSPPPSAQAGYPQYQLTQPYGYPLAAGPQGQPPGYVPQGYVPPPPPSGPPPIAPQQSYPTYNIPAGGYNSSQSSQQQQQSNQQNGQRNSQPGQGDPWSGLNSWK